MATITHAGAIDDTNAGNKTVTATPAVNDLIVVFAHTTNAAGPTTAVSDNNSDGLGTYTQIGSAATESGNGKNLQCWIRNSLVGSASSTIFTATQSGSSGGGLNVFRVSGMTKTGSNAALQNAAQSSGAAAATPAPAFGATPQSGNPVLGGVKNGSNPAGMTPRSGYTEAPTPDTGYNTPAAGHEAMFRDSGETSATITWGGASATVFCAKIVELDSSGAAAASLVDKPDARKRFWTRW